MMSISVQKNQHILFLKRQNLRANEQGKALYKKYIASEGKIVYNVLNMIRMGVVPIGEKFR